MKNKIKVYIASPYTKGDSAKNVRRQIDVVDDLMNRGFAPFAPLYSHFQHMVHPRSYEDWMEIDKFWVRDCHCVLRLGGESQGADIEVQEARKFGKPVFYTIEELVKYYN